MNTKLRRLVFAGYAGLVAIASLLPKAGAVVGPYDKSAHLLVYTFFAILAYRLRLAQEQYVYLSIGIIAYSGLLEVGQSFVPGREMSALDLLANTLGVVLGTAICRLTGHRL